MSVTATPQHAGFNGAWDYAGCLVDMADGAHTFPWQLEYPGTLTANVCLGQCASFGYMAAALGEGFECYCGDPANVYQRGSTFVDEDQCGITCQGNSSNICGGNTTLSTYFWTGDPPNSWAFAEGAAAGRYDFLVGGVVVPLITTQSITGKVTFLEKSGSGPPNSTGAYELDLGLVDDFDSCWREMHVKTDIFCAAGVVLPDRAGRQMTIGGWQGPATFGVRFYTPDGTNGVNGTNDWEEDVNSVALQNGRWYPSAMVMANGSILVVGGEDGPDGAAVPTLEILPQTGTPPIYAEWLQRTHPNNLYPFLAILPSGGILVTYWNEARVLNEVTLATERMLPAIPGAVNNPAGGRTYPFEGTAVLMPQHAPYSAPLEVMICGGATAVGFRALDNCVSIAPDEPDADWTIERMPSERVMPCIAPLPDGTYLMLNGAKTGVAGFANSEDPNLNAVLYDPSKPVGHRFTVLANTTIARLYHSEAITLLDGRVLVSGSDPQDSQHPQEYRVETFSPPYLTLYPNSTRPTFSITNTDWDYDDDISFTLDHEPANRSIRVSLLGAVSSTHGNSMGARTIFPEVSCEGTRCTVRTPPGPYVCPPGWYQLFVLDGPVPGEGVYVRIGGDPGGLGDWPEGEQFTRPGV